jgi:hypothetical protein
MSVIGNKIFSLFDPSTITASQSFITKLVNNEWFRITALGWLLSKAQNAFSILDPFSRLLRFFYVETTHHQRAGDTYNWLLAFWRRHPKFMLKARRFAIENRGNEQQERRMGYGPNHHVIADDAPIAELMRETLELQEERLSIAYTPSDGESFWFWHRGTLFCLSMACHDVGSNGRIDMYGRPLSSRENQITVW